MDKLSVVKENLQKSIDLKNQLIQDSNFISTISSVAEKIIECYQQEGKVLFCGNGGSAADSQHLAAELSGRYYYDRPPLFSEALHVNTSYVTAVANDYSYEEVYARLTKAMGKKDDILIGLSTSGNSKNVIRAFEEAQQIGMLTIGMTGSGGGKMKALSDIFIEIPSKDTPRIQECHMLAGHTICEIVEQTLFPQS